MKEMKESFIEYISEHDQGILQRGEDADIDVAERAFQRAWGVQQEKIEKLEERLKEAELAIAYLQNFAILP